MALTGTIRRTVDLDKGIKCDHFERLFATADDEAHTFEITVTASGKPVDLTGAGVMGYFIRKDKETVVVKGSAASNVATVRLAESCYVEKGFFNFIIKTSSGGKPVAVYWADGTVTRSSTDAIIDPGHEIPSLEELLAHIAEMEAATSAATSAAKTANDAAGKANTATSAANTAASSANTAAQAANTAKANADAATNAANDAAASATSAASSATTAAGSANTAASSANTAAQAANTAKTNADAATKAANDAAASATTATTNANAATTKANAAAGLIENMTVSASKVAPGGSPTAALTKATNPDRYNLALGLVTGDTGAAAGFGTITATVDNKVGTPSVDVTATGANTAKNITFNFHNLKGIPGEGSVSTVWGTLPDNAGDVSPEVGGTNLLPDTSNYIGWLPRKESDQYSFPEENVIRIISKDNSTNSFQGMCVALRKKDSYKEMKGKTYALSFDVKSENWDAVTDEKGQKGLGAVAVQILSTTEPYEGNTVTYGAYAFIRLDNDFFHKVTPTNGEWLHIVSKPFVIEQSLFSNDAGKFNEETYPYIGFNFHLRMNGDVYWRNFKLEEGVVSTDWSPAPEDLSFEDFGGKNYALKSTVTATRKDTSNSYLAELIPVFNISDYGKAAYANISYISLSFDYEINNITTETFIYFSPSISSTTYYGRVKPPIYLGIGDNSGHYQGHYKLVEKNRIAPGKFLISNFQTGKNEGATVKLTNIKLEAGLVCTDYTQAPENLYSADNPPPYSVTSVNGETGAVTVTDITGNAGTATKLATPRTFPAVNLGSTAVSEFDGSKNPTALGISGTLPVSHGGTGSTTASGGLSNLGGVPTSRKVNGKPLSSDITLSASDVKARPSTWTPSLSDLGAQAALGFTPVQQGGGTDQGTNKVYIGWDGATGRLKAQVDSTDLGGIWVDSKPVIDPEGTTAAGWVGGKWNLIDIFNLCKRGMWIGQTKPDTWVNDDLPHGANAYGTLQMWHPYSGAWGENYGCAIYIDRENNFYFGTANHVNGRFIWNWLAPPTPIPVTSVNGQTGAVQLDANSVGARPASWTPTPAEIGAPKFTLVWDSGLGAGANFPAQTLSCPGMAGHPWGFVLFGVKSKTVPYYIQWFWYGRTTLVGKLYSNDGTSTFVSRQMDPNFDANNIIFGSGYANGAQDDTRCVPISIYVCSL